MQVRLGFAVATALTPDILVLDEVLAVGDTSFRHKCYNRINAIMKNCAVVMVSHNMSHIAAVCDVVGFMSKGTFEYHSDKIAGIGAYDAAMNRNSGTRSASDGVVFQVYSPVEHAEIVVRTPEIHYGETLEVDVHLKLSDSIKRLNFSFTAVNEQQQPVLNWNLSRANKPVALEAGESVFRFAIPNLFLHDGNYRCNLWLGEMDSIKANVYAMGVDGFSVKSDCRPISNIPYLPMPNAFEVVRP